MVCPGRLCQPESISESFNFLPYKLNLVSGNEAVFLHASVFSCVIKIFIVELG